MTHILLELPELYENMIESIEDELDYEKYPLTIENISDKLSANIIE